MYHYFWKHPSPGIHPMPSHISPLKLPALSKLWWISKVPTVDGAKIEVGGVWLWGTPEARTVYTENVCRTGCLGLYIVIIYNA